MKYGKGLKTISILAAAMLVIALVLVLDARVENAVQKHIAPRMQSAALSAGFTLSYDDVSFNPLTGLSLDGVTISNITGDGPRPILNARSATLLASLHFLPSLRVRIDGVKLDQPRFLIALDDVRHTQLPPALTSMLRGSDAAGTQGFLSDAHHRAIVPIPLVVAPTLKLVWKNGETTILAPRPSIHEAAHGLILRTFSGSIVYNRKSGDASLQADARVGVRNGALAISAARTNGSENISLSAQHISFDTLAPFLPRFVIASPKAVADFKLQATSHDGGSLWNAAIEFGLDDLSLQHWRLADRRIEDIDFRLSGKFLLDALDRRIDFDNLHLDIDGFPLHTSGFTALSDGFQMEMRMNSGRVSIQKMLEAIPKGFAPLLRDAQVKGAIDIGLNFAIDTNNLSRLIFEPQIEVKGFELLRAPKAVDIERLKKPFLHRARKNGKVLKEFLVGQTNYWFVPFKRLGTNTIKGVLTCEDGSFFRHGGFRTEHFRESLIQDIRERRFARGASTITMQTAKNLFLTGKKNLSRKFQEILIAYAMEQTLTKERILEIYMNIIEWGPNLYGVGAASKHYFDKWPKDLDPVEAAFLGSIIPTATRSHYMYRQGFVPDHWGTYLALIVSKMGIEGDEYAALEPFQPEFGWVRKKRMAEEKKQPSKAPDEQNTKKAESASSEGAT